MEHGSNTDWGMEKENLGDYWLFIRVSSVFHPWLPFLSAWCRLGRARFHPWLTLESWPEGDSHAGVRLFVVRRQVADVGRPGRQEGALRLVSGGGHGAGARRRNRGDQRGAAADQGRRRHR